MVTTQPIYLVERYGEESWGVSKK